MRCHSVYVFMEISFTKLSPIYHQNHLILALHLDFAWVLKTKFKEYKLDINFLSCRDVQFLEGKRFNVTSICFISYVTPYIFHFS